MDKTPEYVKAREKAIRCIMYKTRTSSEIYNKLLELEFSPEVISRVIRDLIDLDYINDERYVKKFIENEKKKKKTSKSMIKLKLKNKNTSQIKQSTNKKSYELIKKSVALYFTC